MMIPESDIERLSAYIDDELSPDERAELERRLEESETLRRALDSLRGVRDWFREYPGRHPSRDVWPQIAEQVAARAPNAAEPRRGSLLPRLVATLAALPPFGWVGAPGVLKRLAIGMLVGIALAGMGRQVYLERRAAVLEEANRLRDEQLLQIAADANWHATAVDFRGLDGQRFSLRCPRVGRAGTVWGTGVYTDDSSVCTAAAHAGLITLRQGGVVTIEIRPGEEAYLGSSRNGIETRDYGSYSGSFVFLDPSQWGGTTEPAAELISWSANAMDLRDQNGERITFQCPGGGEPGTVWGTDTYTDDSSICTAATHAGLITVADGGVVTIEVVPGLPRYHSTNRYGIESRSYPSWGGSFRIVTDGYLVEPAAPIEPETIEWSTTAQSMRGWEGFRMTFRCPPGGAEGSVWGSGIFTDDSSICTAAVHRGLATPEDGGLVTIEIRPGLSRYQGTLRNGVETNDFGPWSGSFSFVTDSR